MTTLRSASDSEEQRWQREERAHGEPTKCDERELQHGLDNERDEHHDANDRTVAT